MCNNSGVSHEIIMLILGAILGLFASLITLVIQCLLDKKGKLNIFYQFTYQKGMGGESWGFMDEPFGGFMFVLPVVFEFQNTSNTTRVIRDVSMNLYNGEKFVARMRQIDYYSITRRKGKSISKKEEYFGTEKGSYSFVIPPRSIQRQECEYIYKVGIDESEENHFDTIVATYYDERNKVHEFRIRTITNCWVNRMYDVDEEWKMFD